MGCLSHQCSVGLASMIAALIFVRSFRCITSGFGSGVPVGVVVFCLARAARIEVGAGVIFETALMENTILSAWRSGFRPFYAYAICGAYLDRRTTRRLHRRPPTGVFGPHSRPGVHVYTLCRNAFWKISTNPLHSRLLTMNCWPSQPEVKVPHPLPTF